VKSIEENAIITYQKNLSYLKEYDQSLYNRVQQLSLLIQNGEYQSRYQLEYIEDDKQFDIYDSATSSHIYGKKASVSVKNSLKEIDFDKKNSIDLLDSNLYNVNSAINIEESLRQEDKTPRYVANDIYEYYKVFQKSTLDKDKKFKYIEKFIFIGTLLGIDILPIDKKLNSKLYLICEYNLEIFRLALFVTDFSLLAKNSKVIFSIMDDDSDFKMKVNQFLHFSIRSNFMIKYHCSNYNIGNYFDKILEVASSSSPLQFAYPRMFFGLLEPVFYNINKYPVLDTKTEHNLLKDKQVIFLGAGPSLGNNIKWLHKNKNKFIIVAIGTVLKILVENNIKPDLIVTVDGDEIISEQFNDEVIKFIEEVPVLASTITNKNVLDKLDYSNIILFESMGRFKDSSVPMYGVSVGEIGLSIISILGGDKIYMLGTDLALDQESGTTHSGDHFAQKKYNIDTKMEHNSFMENENFDLGNTTTIVKGNFKEKVVTTLIMQKSIPLYNKITTQIVEKSPNTKIYNLSNGAFFANTISVKPEELNVEMVNKNIDILKYLKDKSNIKFTNNEKQTLIKSTDKVKMVISELNKIKTLKVKSYDHFIQQREGLMTVITKELKNYSRYYIDRIFTYYILTIEPYLGFHFNEKLKNEVNLIKKVKKIWIEQMLKLCNKYKDCILENINKL